MSTVPPPPSQATPHGHTLVIVSGMSGSGKSVALKTLEDLGFYCVDNLPAELLSHFAQSVSADETGTPAKLAVGIDVRNRRDLANIPDWLAAVGALGFDPKLVFFDTRDEVLLKRYAETRRRHPLSQLGLPLVDAIGLERQVLKPLRQLADAVVDTSDLNVHQLRRLVTTDFAAGHDNTILLMFESFAYRRGIPADADYVFDARILPNPHWDPSLRPLSGRDAGVREYLEREPDVQLFVQQVSAFLDTWLPRIKQADTTRSYVTVAFGCTGGRHRSVYLAEQMARHARDQGWPDVAVHHRELD